ncbi:MAG TPA: hypothetical protein VG649_05215, partial [Candidatus Angelobacter sp.]|nr:hypothetical protein [Candidatus Angelobacter sp.]
SLKEFEVVRDSDGQRRRRAKKLAQRVNAGKRLEINDKPQRGGTDFRFVSALKLLIEKVHQKLE